MNDCTRNLELLMGLMDGELTDAETVEVHDHLRRCASCREEYDQLREISGKIEMISFTEPQDEILRDLWKSPYSRFTRNAGLFMVLVGILGLVLFAVYEFATKAEFNFPTLAAATVWIGLAILFFSILRERLKTYKSDPYREVER
ncbi:MAG: zf-HC2 domain-containing protein [Gemmatimonadetes bacterium]|jgi:predicted anti-sigma-YlaC factor YlaD|nr:zf-HC2 domain-containing protein [Gemmatimonadota bacterium]